MWQIREADILIGVRVFNSNCIKTNVKLAKKAKNRKYSPIHLKKVGDGELSFGKGKTIITCFKMGGGGVYSRGFTVATSSSER